MYAFRAVGMEFLSTPSARRATWWSTQTRSTSPFLSTPSARRATRQLLGSADAISISIHALREEGDLHLHYTTLHRVLFLSTPSARRATFAPSAAFLMVEYFYPRPPRGGRLLPMLKRPKTVTFLSTPSARRATEARRPRGREGRISIHALREEGDSEPADGKMTKKEISIHALREEGDVVNKFTELPKSDFYPRPPRGGRPAASVAAAEDEFISIHALREEGDPHSPSWR